MGGRRATSKLSTKVGDEVGPRRGKSFECDVNELLVGRAIANGIKLGDHGINTSNVLVCIIALHFNNRKRTR